MEIFKLQKYIKWDILLQIHWKVSTRQTLKTDSNKFRINHHLLFHFLIGMNFPKIHFHPFFQSVYVKSAKLSTSTLHDPNTFIFSKHGCKFWWAGMAHFSCLELWPILETNKKISFPIQFLNTISCYKGERMKVNFDIAELSVLETANGTYLITSKISFTFTCFTLVLERTFWPTHLLAENGWIVFCSHVPGVKKYLWGSDISDNGNNVVTSFDSVKIGSTDVWNNQFLNFGRFIWSSKLSVRPIHR